MFNRNFRLLGAYALALAPLLNPWGAAAQADTMAVIIRAPLALSGQRVPVCLNGTRREIALDKAATGEFTFIPDTALTVSITPCWDIREAGFPLAGEPMPTRLELNGSGTIEVLLPGLRYAPGDLVLPERIHSPFPAGSSRHPHDTAGMAFMQTYALIGDSGRIVTLGNDSTFRMHAAPRTLSSTERARIAAYTQAPQAGQWPAVTFQAMGGRLDVSINVTVRGSTLITRGVKPQEQHALEWLDSQGRAICRKEIKLPMNVRRTYMCDLQTHTVLQQ
jgi:hypothetical protein